MPSPFYESLERLRQAAFERQDGFPPNLRVVNVRDLVDLIFHFDRLDREVRVEHERRIDRERGRMAK